MLISTRRQVLLEEAKKLTNQGFWVMPLMPNRKEPHFDLIKRGHLDATTDIDLINFWIDFDENINLGINCIKSGLVVFDVDFRNGGQLEDWMTSSLLVETGDGFHSYFKTDSENLRAKLNTGTDIKHKGYVVIPPSTHPNGKTYKYFNNLQIANLSDDIREMIER